MSSVRLIFTTILILIVAGVGLSFVNPDFAQVRQLISVDWTCKFSRHRDCFILFESYRSSRSHRELAERAGHWACRFKNPTACAELGQIYEDERKWPLAIVAYAEACDLKLEKACIDELVLTSGSGQVDEALLRGRELCQRDVPMTCYLSGILAQKLKDRETATWALYEGCFKQSTTEACIALSKFYTFQKQLEESKQALVRACDLGSTLACLQNTVLANKPAAVAPAPGTAVNIRKPAARPGQH